MALEDGYHSLSPGKIAAVVTYLEMLERPAERLTAAIAGLDVVHVPKPQLEWYKDLFRAVGADWMWFSRLSMDDVTLSRAIHGPLVEVYTLQQDQVESGILELDFRRPNECEIVYFGVTAPAIGTGAARLLMNAAMQRVWSGSRPVKRVSLHTNSLDHPKALAFYLRTGFKAYARAIEIADDPRLDGRLPLL